MNAATGTIPVSASDQRILTWRTQAGGAGVSAALVRKTLFLINPNVRVFHARADQEIHTAVWRIDRRLGAMEDPFAARELRIRQPARMMPGRARYDFFDAAKKLIAVAAETEPRSVLQTMADLVPRTRVLGVRSASGEPILTMVKRDADWMADLSDPGGQLIGKIEIGETRRHYTMFNEAGELAGQVVGDLAVKKFSITGPGGERYAQVRKTWAGLGKELLTSSDHYTVTFTGPMSPQTRMMVVMVPIILDMTRHGPY